VVYPCEKGVDCLPDGTALSDFDGVVWTGSSLNAYERDIRITAQRRLADRVFAAGLPVFGSCWGLQICTVALGGTVRLNPVRREVGLAENITPTESGRSHPMLAGRPASFNAFAAHTDEVEELPDGAVVLAGNEVSAVQAMSVEHGSLSLWAVQYHPEFDHRTVVAIMRRTGDALVKAGLYPNRRALDTAADEIAQVAVYGDAHLDGPLADPSLATASTRGLEILNWLHQVSACSH
jgi:GMP synthase (glutamine-hydrolysing)